MIRPEVSIIIPLYNKENEIGRAIRSVLDQTFQDFELIVINDGTTDGSVDIAKSFSDPRIRIIDQINAGVSVARNRGISEARSGLIAFIDADDEWTQCFLETILNLRSNYPACKVFGTRYISYTVSGLKKMAVINGISHDMQEGILTDYFIVAAQSDPLLCSSAIAIAKEAIESIGGFPLGVTSGEDLLTWARLAVRFQIAYSMKPCAIYHKPQMLINFPRRIPQEPDIVGDSLRRMIRQDDFTMIRGLKSYIALWHKMRAVIFLQLGEMRKVRQEVKMAMDFAPSLRLAMIFLISIFPGTLASRLLAVIQEIKESQIHWHIK